MLREGWVRKRPPEAPSYLCPEKTPQIALKSAIDYPYKAIFHATKSLIRQSQQTLSPDFLQMCQTS